MNIATALYLALTLISQDKPARVVSTGHNQAVVLLEGRPGCHGEALNGDPTDPVVVCKN